MNGIPSEFIRLLFTVFIVMDPVGIVPQFLSFTAHYDKKARRDIILKAVLIAGIVLLIFLLAGKLLLEFFHIMPGAFYISGGILFFMIAFGMIYSKHGMDRDVPKKEAGAEKETAKDKAAVSVALFPLAIPLIAGPGLLTVIIMFISNGESWFYSVGIMLPAIVLNLIAAYIILRCSELLLKFLGFMGISIMEKIMGLILAGFAVQFIYDGLLALGFIHP